MIETNINNLPVLQFKIFSTFPELQHFSTTRAGGVSSGKYQNFNLGLHSGDHPEEVLKNRTILCHSLNISSDHLIFPRQTHTMNIKLISKEFLHLTREDQRVFLQETDALITDLKGYTVAVKTADCVPVLLYDPQRKIIAAIHAGWRGTLLGITGATVEKMVRESGSNPKNIFAGIGPSISPEVYEVGKDVWQQFSLEYYHSNGFLDSDKKLLNLWKANYHQLVESGIPEQNIELAEMCTFSNATLFFSARRDGINSGRMATGIMLKN